MFFRLARLVEPRPRKMLRYRNLAYPSLPSLCDRRLMLALAAVLAVPAFAHAQPPVDIGASRLENAIVASVDGKPITLRDLLAYEATTGKLRVATLICPLASRTRLICEIAPSEISVRRFSAS